MPETFRQRSREEGAVPDVVTHSDLSSEKFSPHTLILEWLIYMKAKLKSWLKILDVKFPSLRFLVKKFPLITSVARATGFVSPEAIGPVGGNPLSNCSVDGFPSSSVFGPDFFKDNVYLLMGVTSHHPVLDKMFIKVTAVDGDEDIIYKHGPVVLTGMPVAAPVVVESLLPDCIAWFQVPIPGLPRNFERMTVRYYSNLVDLKTQPVPQGFRFCSLVINRLDSDDEGRSLINLATCSPIVVRGR